MQNLQRRLSSVGKALKDDGDYGDVTDKAVREWQGENELKSDGVVGPVTTDALRRGPSPVEQDPGPAAKARDLAAKAGVGAKGDGVPAATPKVKAAAKSEVESFLFKGHGIGDASSNGVAMAQANLAVMGYGIPVDGRFGPVTERAAKAFQRRYGMKTDGIVGPKTRRTLKGAMKGSLLAEGLLEEAGAAPVDELVALEEANAGFEKLIALFTAQGFTPKQAVAMAMKTVKGKQPTASRGGDRKAKVEMKRLPSGQFAPSGQGQILRPGQVVDVPHKSGKGHVQGVMTNKGKVKLANGPDAGQNLVLKKGGGAPSEPKPGTPEFDAATQRHAKQFAERYGKAPPEPKPGTPEFDAAKRRNAKARKERYGEGDMKIATPAKKNADGSQAAGQTQKAGKGGSAIEGMKVGETKDLDGVSVYRSAQGFNVTGGASGMSFYPDAKTAAQGVEAKSGGGKKPPASPGTESYKPGVGPSPDEMARNAESMFGGNSPQAKKARAAAAKAAPKPGPQIGGRGSVHRPGTKISVPRDSDEGRAIEKEQSPKPPASPGTGRVQAGRNPAESRAIETLSDRLAELSRRGVSGKEAESDPMVKRARARLAELQREGGKKPPASPGTGEDAGRAIAKKHVAADPPSLNAKQQELQRKLATRKPVPPQSPGTDDVTDVGGDVNRAADLLAQGKKVRLNQPREVSTLLDELAKRVKEAKEKGDSAPDFDLCKVTVKNSNLFCSESRGVPRIKMPQLKGVPEAGSKAAAMGANDKGEVDLAAQFREMLAARGVKIEDAMEQAAYLRASQMELNGGKVAGMTKALEAGKSLGDDPLFVSSDDYIVDGHHRWAAQVSIDLGDNVAGDVEMAISRVDMSIIELLDEANKFAQEWGIPQAGVGAQVPKDKPPRPKVPGGGGDPLADVKQATGAKQPPVRVGVTPFRPEDDQGGFFDSPKFAEFEQAIKDDQEAFGVTVGESVRNRGVYQGGEEPSVALTVDGDAVKVRGFMASLGKRFDQDAVAAFGEGDDGPGARYRLTGITDPDRAQELAAERLGFANIEGDALEHWDSDGSAFDKIDALAKELGVGYKVTLGTVEFIERKDYDQVIANAQGEDRGLATGDAEARGPEGGNAGSGRGPPGQAAQEVAPRTEEALSFAGRRVALVGDDVPDAVLGLLEAAGRLTRGTPKPDVVISRGSSARKRARSLGIEAYSWNDVGCARESLREAEVVSVDPAGFAIYAQQMDW